jgi:hypothetical protein
MEENKEQASFEWEFDCIEDSLRRLNFIKDGYFHVDEGEEGVYGQMVEGVLPGIIVNLEAGFSELREKLAQNPSSVADKDFSGYGRGADANVLKV